LVNKAYYYLILSLPLIFYYIAPNAWCSSLKAIRVQDDVKALHYSNSDMTWTLSKHFNTTIVCHDWSKTIMQG